MRIGLLVGLFFAACCGQVAGQQGCASFNYQQQLFQADPSLKMKVSEIEAFIQQQKSANRLMGAQKGHLPLITIPVVIHILYNNDEQNVPDAFITNQLQTMNSCFRHQNADSVNTPVRFQPLAADCDIEFKLAISDPQGRPTTGVVRKYTNNKKWYGDDQMKYSSKGGDDAWDSHQYLNIWVCNISYVLGYATFPGGPADIDGVVLHYNVFKWNKTSVHETGHWLGLKHIWGDADCGDDLVGDTPKQSSYSSDCPTGIRLSCGNTTTGDMYMNYMDLSSDACINMFTEGQKERMRIVFEEGGARHSILSSRGLLPPTNTTVESPLPTTGQENARQEPPVSTVSMSHIFPNPASAEVTFEITNSKKWIGKTVTILAANGQPLLRAQIGLKATRINISSLKPGIYFLTTKHEDGTTIEHKLVKL
jgi:hypothetical protein